MRNVLNVVFKLIAFLLAVVAIFATIFALLFLSFNRILLDPQTYKQALADNHVYEQLPAVTAKEFTLIQSRLGEPCAEAGLANTCLDSNAPQPVNSVETGGLGQEGRAFIHALNEDQWNRLVGYLLPPHEVQKSLEAGIDEIIAYFRGEADRAGFPFVDLKTRLSGMTERQLTELLLHSPPRCTLEQETKIMSGETGSVPIFCAATNGTSQVLVRDLQRRLNLLAGEFPAQLTVIEAPPPLHPPGIRRILGNDLKATLQTLQTNSQYIPFLPAGVLVLVTILAVRSLRGLLRWWSIPIFIAGLLTLILSLAVFFMFHQLWLNFVLKDVPPVLTSGFGEVIYNVTHSLLKDVSQHLMLQAGITTLLALGLLGISNRVPAPPDPSLPPLAPPGTPGGPVLNPNRKKRKW